MSASPLAAASYLSKDLTDEQIESMVYDAVVWANQHGLVRQISLSSQHLMAVGILFSG